MVNWQELLSNSRDHMDTIIESMTIEIERDIPHAFGIWEEILKSDDVWKTDSTYMYLYITEILHDFNEYAEIETFEIATKNQFFLEQLFQNAPEIGEAQLDVIATGYEKQMTDGLDAIRAALVKNPNVASADETMRIAWEHLADVLYEFPY